MNLRIKTSKRQKYNGYCRAVSLCVLLISICNLAFGQAKDYPNAYKDLMVAYKAEGMKVMSAPLPAKTLPKAKKRDLIAQHVEDIAKYHQKYSDRIKTLNPPKQFREVHLATLDMFSIQAIDNRRWAEAIRHSNSKERHRIFQESNIHLLDKTVRIKKALNRLGASSPQVDSLIIELQQENKKP